jgi:hypothetical protein
LAGKGQGGDDRKRHLGTRVWKFVARVCPCLTPILSEALDAREA